MLAVSQTFTSLLQIEFYDQLKDGKSEKFFEVFHEKIELAQQELKNSSTVNTGNRNYE